jgi:hypothetical protein
VPTLDPVGREYAPTKEYEPIHIPIIAHRVADRSEVLETFAFRGERGLGKTLVFERRVIEEGQLTYGLVLDYLESAALDGEFEKFKAFIDRADVEVHQQTIVDAQQLLAAEYQKGRPTPARSSSGRSNAKRTSVAGSREKASASTRSPRR